MNKNLSRGGLLKAIGLLVVSLAIAAGPMRAIEAKGLDPVDNWPKLKAMLHDAADKRAVSLSRGSSLSLNASNGTLAPNLSRLWVKSLSEPTVKVPANGILTFAIDVSEAMYVTGSVSIAAELGDLRPGLRAYVLSDTTVVGAPMIHQQAPPGGQIDFNLPGEMPNKRSALRTWRLEPGRHYISIVGPSHRAIGIFEGLELRGLDRTVKTPVYSFAQLTDTHIGDAYHGYTPWAPHRSGEAVVQMKNTFKALQQEGILFAIITGDITDTAKPSHFEQLAEAVAAGRAGGLEIYGVMGNHDARYPDSRARATAIPGLFPEGKTNYVLKEGPLRMIIVDGGYYRLPGDKWTSWDDPARPEIDMDMRPQDKEWLARTLAEDSSTTTMVISHWPFLVKTGPTQCGYVLRKHFNADIGSINDILKAAPNVIATLSGHYHWNHVALWKNNFGHNITSLQMFPFSTWPAGYRVFRVYSDRGKALLEWETRLVDNMGYVATADGKHPPDPDPTSNFWHISTSYGIDLVSDPIPE